MNNKKKIIIGFCITLASLNTYAADKFIDCEYNSITELLQKMKTSKEFISKNVFNTDECLTYITSTDFEPSLKKEDFEFSVLYEDYKNLTTKSETKVITHYNPNSGKFYQFFKIDENDNMYKAMKHHWSKGNKTMTENFDEFIKLHELAHLDNVKHRMERNSMETLADISATIIISFNRSFTVKETIDFLEHIQQNRVKERRIGMKDNFGKILDKDDHHYDKKFFTDFIKDLKRIDNKDQLLKETDLFINTKDVDVVKFIKDRYKPK